jgi:type I restriction enzyme S subunit
MFTGLDGVLSSTMAKLIPTSSDFEKAYVRYFVGYNGLRLSGAQEGGAIPHLDREKLLKFSIPVLEKKEQYLVVERLNASELAVQFVKQRTELLRAQKRGLMQKLLTGEVRVAA